MATDALRQASARSDAEIALIANRMRHDIIEMLGAAGSGHPGGSLSATDIMGVMGLGARQGDELRFSVEGPDEQSTADRLRAKLESCL